MSNDIKIVALPKDKWKGTTIPLVTRSDSFYDIEIAPLDREGGPDQSWFLFSQGEQKEMRIKIKRLMDT